MESVNTHIITSGSPHAAIENCYERGWTDGLPVVPPTPDRVASLLDFVGLGPEEILGEVPVRSRSLTAEQAAANSVMAGCLPEYFPIVLVRCGHYLNMILIAFMNFLRLRIPPVF